MTVFDWNGLAIAALQLGAGLLLARLTVSWALERYKKEKLWERRSAAYTEVLAGLGTLRTADERNLAFFKASGRLPDPSTLKAQYDEIATMLNSACEKARLVLPDEAVVEIDTFFEGADPPLDMHYPDAVVTRIKKINRLILRLTNLSRDEIGLTQMSHIPDRRG